MALALSAIRAVVPRAARLVPRAAALAPRAAMLSNASSPELPDHLLTLQARRATPTSRSCNPRAHRSQEELASGDAQLFDVREPTETAAGRLRSAICVPLSELREGKVSAELDTSKVRG